MKFNKFKFLNIYISKNEAISIKLIFETYHSFLIFEFNLFKIKLNNKFIRNFYKSFLKKKIKIFRFENFGKMNKE